MSINIVNLTIGCQPVTAISAANIFPIDLNIVSTSCTIKCSMVVDVTYINSGDITGTFTPNITVDGIAYNLPADSLDPSITVIKTFSVTDISRGEHIACADSICKTVNFARDLTPLIGIGMLFGLLYKKDCEDYKTKEECVKNDCTWLEDKKKCVIKRIPIAPGILPMTHFTTIDESLIKKLRDKGAVGNPICKDQVCRIGKWVAIYNKGKEPIIIHDP